MEKNGVDYFELDKKTSNKIYKLADVKDQIEVVGFDIVRFRDNDRGAELWQVQSADDGDYIVALYEDEPEIEKTASKKEECNCGCDKKKHKDGKCYSDI